MFGCIRVLLGAFHTLLFFLLQLSRLVYLGKVINQIKVLHIFEGSLSKVLYNLYVLQCKWYGLVLPFNPFFQLSLTSSFALALKHVPLPLSHPLLSPLFLSGPASSKMKHRLPSSGTSTIFMLSQTASTHSFSWSDWGLSLSSCQLLYVKTRPAEFLCQPVLIVSFHYHC